MRSPSREAFHGPSGATGTTKTIPPRRGSPAGSTYRGVSWSPCSLSLLPLLAIDLAVTRAAGVRDGVAHAGVGLQIAQVVIFVDAQMPLAKGLGDGERDLGLRLHDLRAVLLHQRLHLLL